MSGTFSGLEIIRRSLSTYQQAVETTQNNIANANTEGYSRQRVVLSATGTSLPPSLSKEQINAGVEIKSIQRMRDDFLDPQLRANLSEIGYWEEMESELAKVGYLFTDTTGTGVSSLLTEFWNSWQELSSNPQESSARQNITHTAATLTSYLNYLTSQMETAHTEIESSLASKVSEMNELAASLADVNQALKKCVTAENNTLMDQRDHLLDEMSRLSDITITFNDNNTATVVAYGKTIVEGQDADPLLESDLSSGKGELGGLLAAKQSVEDYQDKMNLFIQTLADKVNEIHEDGYTLNDEQGVAFFTVQDTAAGNKEISVNEDILNDPNNIAAAQESSSPSDGRNAMAIAGINNTAGYAELGNNSLAGYYSQLITTIGSDQDQAGKNADFFNSIGLQFEAQRQSLSGVSIDEELTMLMQYQFTYQALSKAMSIFDDMLDTLINRT
ncbi:MAG TPA: flagellar hook-associated protein FlgK [Desulfotomaculum sp.]|nr:MAG: Flagellar hook-associated protein [Desulfotomaculum sp. 46_80]HAG11537.1 flagellar hook-associated protein FlgK [Desulfotomaculum sp.]HBY03759.1 flagellar hook-associated protein FlgK [Desulfotomaculum sp.]